MTLPRVSHWIATSLLAAQIVVLAACGSTPPTAMAERPAEDMFNEGMGYLRMGAPFDAAKLFEEVDRQHPYSVWATKSQLLYAYSLYEMNKYDDAIVALNRFLTLHPGSRDAAYAYYLKGLSYYERIADIRRDQEITNKALEALQEVIRRFPDSTYARDARLKIDLTRDNLAGKEMEVGRFYQTRNQFLAAINRYRRVVEGYQTTSHVPEALHRLTECYLAIGVVNEAKTAAAVLGHNYPGSTWYSDSYALMTGIRVEPAEDTGSWISRAWQSVF